MQGSCECDALPSRVSPVHAGLVLDASAESGNHAGLLWKRYFAASENQLLGLIRAGSIILRKLATNKFGVWSDQLRLLRELQC